MLRRVWGSQKQASLDTYAMGTTAAKSAILRICSWKHRTCAAHMVSCPLCLCLYNFVQGCGSKLVPLVNIKIAGNWMLISLKMDVFNHPCAAWLRHSFKRLCSINQGFIRRRFNLVMDLPVIIRKKCSHFGVMRVLAIWGKDHPDLQQLGLNEKSLIYNNLLIYFVHSHWLKLWLKCVFLPS